MVNVARFRGDVERDGTKTLVKDTISRRFHRIERTLSMSEPVSSETLNEMVDYYRARANEYDEWFYRRGRYDRGPETNVRWHSEVNEVFAALDALGIEGDIL